MADQDDSATAILRRIEPVLAGLVAEIKEMRDEIKDMRKDIVDLKVAVASKPGRGELWGAMTGAVAMFALILGGLTYLAPMVRS